MKRILAISGGVDSMVMLDILAHNYSAEGLVVAHFDHGIREHSDEDAAFVKRQAQKYGVDFVSERAELGINASEADARESRYSFLRKIARKFGGEIYTAHHLDDLIGSIAINLIRGTGWRGLAVLDTPGLRRPFLDDFNQMGFVHPPAKRDLLCYAGEHQLCFREDPSNSWDDYLRNRLREQIDGLMNKEAIFELWCAQKVLSAEIDAETSQILPKKIWQRKWFNNLDDTVALEILKSGLDRAGIMTTRPQRQEFLRAIREYAPGKNFNLPNDVLIRMNKTSFEL